MRNLANVHQNMFESLKIGTLMGSFYPKQKMYELNIYRGVLCQDIEEWCKVWRGIDLSVQNWQEKFDEFWPEHSKISKICTLMGFFWTKYIMFELRIYRGVLCHDNKIWYKIWRRIDLSVQNWHEEFDKFWPEHSKISKICTLTGCFWPKYIMFELKKV